MLLAGVPPLGGWRWVIKDARYRVLALLLLIFTSPVLLATVLISLWFDLKGLLQTAVKGFVHKNAY